MQQRAVPILRTTRSENIGHQCQTTAVVRKNSIRALFDVKASFCLRPSLPGRKLFSTLVPVCHPDAPRHDSFYS